MLVLNTFSSQNHPLLMNSNGLEDYEFNFEYGDNTSAYMSCSLTFRGQMYMFGGEEGYGKGYLKLDLYVNRSNLITYKNKLLNVTL